MQEEGRGMVFWHEKGLTLWRTIEAYMRRRLEKAGYTREMLGSTDAKEDFGSGAKAWRDTWSAGHGVATIHDIPTTSELVARLAAEYRAACALPLSPAVA